MKLKVKNFIYLIKTLTTSLKRNPVTLIIKFDKSLKIMWHGSDAKSRQHIICLRLLIRSHIARAILGNYFGK